MSSLWIKRWLVLPAATAGMVVGMGNVASLRAQTTPEQSAPDQALIEESGTIEPAKDTYRFTGSADQRVTITLDSGDFDPVLMLQDAAGNEIASNDDFGGSLNSKLIVSLPADGEYQVIATSYDGQGGDYDLVVRPPTSYEALYGEGQDLLTAERYEDAIASYSAAIDLAPEEIPAYLGRVEAYLGKIYAEDANIETPQDIPEAIKSAMIADFETAADLIAAEGNLNWAQSLREQAQMLRDNDASSEEPTDTAPTEASPMESESEASPEATPAG